MLLNTIMMAVLYSTSKVVAREIFQASMIAAGITVQDKYVLRLCLNKKPPKVFVNNKKCQPQGLSLVGSRSFLKQLLGWIVLGVFPYCANLLKLVYAISSLMDFLKVIYLFLSLSLPPSLSLCLCLAFSVSVSTCLSLYLSIQPSVCLSVCLSIMSVSA